MNVGVRTGQYVYNTIQTQTDKGERCVGGWVERVERVERGGLEGASVCSKNAKVPKCQKNATDNNGRIKTWKLCWRRERKEGRREGTQAFAGGRL